MLFKFFTAVTSHRQFITSDWRLRAVTANLPSDTHTRKSVD